MMRLHVDRGPVFEEPADSDVEDAVAGLRSAEVEFAILDQRDDAYIQTKVLEGDELFLLEFRDGSPARHFEAPWPCSRGEVIEAFLSYLRDDNRWRTIVEWQRLEGL